MAEYDREFLAERLEYFQQNPAENLFTEELRKSVVDILPNLLKQAAIMDKTYDVLVTNPPYMGSRYMNSLLSDFIKKNIRVQNPMCFLFFLAIV
ncbi:Eco57I restriction-modification methylase domain-containing protein [Bacillus pacificus]